MNQPGQFSGIQSRFFSIKGLQLHTLQAGDEQNPLLILLHGFPVDARIWEEYMIPLAQAGFWVLAPDQRGYNLSDKPPGIASYALDKLAGDVSGLIEATGKDKAFLIGHDWGATVAWWLAMHDAERLHGMVVLNGGHVQAARRFRRRNPWQILKSWYLLVFLIPGLPEFLARRNGWRRFRKSLLKGAAAGTFSEEALAAYQKAWDQPRAFRSMLNWYRAAVLHLPRMKGEYRVGIPVLILWGSKDRYISSKLAQESLRHCDQAKLLMFGEVGHWAFMEEKARSLALIRDFLRTHLS